MAISTAAESPPQGEGEFANTVAGMIESPMSLVIFISGSDFVLNYTV